MATAPGAALAQTRDSEIVDRITRRNPDANHKILLKGGTIVSMDPKVGDFVKGDLLIQGKRSRRLRPRPGNWGTPTGRHSRVRIS